VLCGLHVAVRGYSAAALFARIDVCPRAAVEYNAACAARLDSSLDSQLAACNTLASRRKRENCPESARIPIPCVELRAALGEAVPPSISWGLPCLPRIARDVRPLLLLLTTGEVLELHSHPYLPRRGAGIASERLPSRWPLPHLLPRPRQRRGPRVLLLLARRAAENIPPESTVTIINHHPSVATRATVCRYSSCRPLVACVHIK